MDANDLANIIDVPRNAWDPTEVTRHSRYGERPLSNITGLEVHWAGPGGFQDHGDTGTELLAFERFHEVSKSWYDLFYNLALDSEGYIYEGRNATIPSQSNLYSWLTFLFVAGQEDEPPTLEMYQRLYEAWGAVDPLRRAESLRVHNDRSTTACPGPHIKTGVALLKQGWIPIPEREKSTQVSDAVKRQIEAVDPRISDGTSPYDTALRWHAMLMADRAYKLAVNELRDEIEQLALGQVDANAIARRVKAEVMDELKNVKVEVTSEGKLVF